MRQRQVDRERDVWQVQVSDMVLAREVVDLGFFDEAGTTAGFDEKTPERRRLDLSAQEGTQVRLSSPRLESLGGAFERAPRRLRADGLEQIVTGIDLKSPNGEV